MGKVLLQNLFKTAHTISDFSIEASLFFLHLHLFFSKNNKYSKISAFKKPFSQKNQSSSEIVKITQNISYM